MNNSTRNSTSNSTNNSSPTRARHHLPTMNHKVIGTSTYNPRSAATDSQKYLEMLRQNMALKTQKELQREADLNAEIVRRA
jgi:hypothetical protein